jgi:single-strand DNA-binding protein
MSWDINTVTIVGRLTKDPNYGVTKNNKQLCKFSIANNQGKYNGQDVVNFFDVIVWGKTAEACNQYAKKGSRVAVSGNLKQNRYQDQNGNNRSSIEINAMSVQILDGFKEKSNNQENTFNSGNTFKDDTVFSNQFQ